MMSIKYRSQISRDFRLSPRLIGSSLPTFWKDLPKRREQTPNINCIKCQKGEDFTEESPPHKPSISNIQYLTQRTVLNM